MTEEESVPGLLAGFRDDPADTDQPSWAQLVEAWLNEAISSFPEKGLYFGSGIDVPWLSKHPMALGGTIATSGEGPWVLLKQVSGADPRMEVPDNPGGAYPKPDEQQPALPGLDKLGVSEVSPPDRALLVSVVMLRGLDVEKLSSLRFRIAKVQSIAEVPIRALWNPGKVLGELAEKGEVAKVIENGKTVGWLVPATEAEQHLDTLLRQGRLRRGTPAPIEPINVEGLEKPLSQIMVDARNEERT
ncbi:hypothetical protein [Streptomyces sp. NPDC047999]|uniref:hypothetical protein n=1 Tax=Streptomyces sp. NPDC047999 TaxID=3365497 RepID=UPI003713BFB8